VKHRILLVAASAVGSWLCVGCATVPPDADVMGPLGPMQLPARPARHVPVVASAALAAVLLVVALRVARSRHGATGRAADTLGADLPGDPGDLGSAAFYDALLRALRGGQDGPAGRPVRAMTIREVGALFLGMSAPHGDLQRWGKLCAHAEWAWYAAGRVDVLRRSEDLEFARELLSQACKAAGHGGPEDGL